MAKWIKTTNSIKFSVANRIARITLNRPEKRNAMNAELLQEVSAALMEADDLNDVSVIVIDGEGKKRNNDIHRKMVLAMANEGADFPWEDRYAKFKELLDSSAINLKIYAHPDRKALLSPLMKRAELVMADYEEWVVSDGTSITLGASGDAGKAEVAP